MKNIIIIIGCICSILNVTTLSHANPISYADDYDYVYAQAYGEPTLCYGSDCGTNTGNPNESISKYGEWFYDSRSIPEMHFYPVLPEYAGGYQDEYIYENRLVQATVGGAVNINDRSLEINYSTVLNNSYQFYWIYDETLHDLPNGYPIDVGYARGYYYYFAGGFINIDTPVDISLLPLYNGTPEDYSLFRYYLLLYESDTGGYSDYSLYYYYGGQTFWMEGQPALMPSSLQPGIYRYEFYFEAETSGLVMGTRSAGGVLTLHADPVPIPSTIWLLASSLAGLIHLRRKY
ncbi:MAG: hypothetical protein AB1641_21035 [Thermodesulfobacteriota bacterium]